jgi:hypothetical protein
MRTTRWLPSLASRKLLLRPPGRPRPRRRRSEPTADRRWRAAPWRWRSGRQRDDARPNLSPRTSPIVRANSVRALDPVGEDSLAPHRRRARRRSLDRRRPALPSRGQGGAGVGRRRPPRSRSSPTRHLSRVGAEARSVALRPPESAVGDGRSDQEHAASASRAGRATPPAPSHLALQRGEVFELTRREASEGAGPLVDLSLPDPATNRALLQPVLADELRNGPATRPDDRRSSSRTAASTPTSIVGTTGRRRP